MKSQSECVCRGDEQLAPNGMFWCEPHQCWKTQHWRKLCLTRPGYRKMWEEGRGPGQHSDGGKQSEPYDIAQWGPGSTLKKMLGCGYKRWPLYDEMDAAGAECEVDKYADSLSVYGKIGQSEAARLVRMAIDKYKGSRHGN